MTNCVLCAEGKVMSSMNDWVRVSAVGMSMFFECISRWWQTFVSNTICARPSAIRGSSNLHILPSSFCATKWQKWKKSAFSRLRLLLKVLITDNRSRRCRSFSSKTMGAKYLIKWKRNFLHNSFKKFRNAQLEKQWRFVKRKLCGQWLCTMYACLIVSPLRIDSIEIDRSRNYLRIFVS